MPNRPSIWPIETTSPPTSSEESSDLGSGDALQQFGDALGRLRALAEPVLHALFVDAQLLFLRGGERVVETHVLDELAVGGTPAVSDDQFIERPLLGTATGETN